jgi:CheY-like chemotaxis protein
MELAPQAAPFTPADIRTLIVGDNAFERRLVHDLLITLGVREIILADDAVAAFAQIMLRKPRLVIADAEMRPFSGFMLARELRAAPTAARDIPLILFTSETSPDFAVAAREAGAHEVIAKPVSAEAMRKCLEDAMTRPREFIESKRYKGPDRRQRLMQLAHGPFRRAGDAAPADRAVGLERTARAAVMAAIDEARAKVARWSETGDTALAEGARGAVERASDAAWTGHADPAVTRALAGALRIAEAAALGRADPHVLDVSLAAARAVLAAGQARKAMREALAEAVAEVAESRSTS